MWNLMGDIRNTKYDIRFTIYDLRYTIYDLRYTMCDIRYTIYDIRYTIYDIRFTIYDIRFTIYDVRYTIYDIRFTIYDIRFTIYDVRYTMYEVRFTMYELRSRSVGTIYEVEFWNCILKILPIYIGIKFIFHRNHKSINWLHFIISKIRSILGIYGKEKLNHKVRKASIKDAILYLLIYLIWLNNLWQRKMDCRLLINDSWF